MLRHLPCLDVRSVSRYDLGKEVANLDFGPVFKRSDEFERRTAIDLLKQQSEGTSSNRR